MLSITLDIKFINFTGSFSGVKSVGFGGFAWRNTSSQKQTVVYRRLCLVKILIVISRKT